MAVREMPVQVEAVVAVDPPTVPCQLRDGSVILRVDFSRVVRASVCEFEDEFGEACADCDVCFESLTAWTPRTVDMLHLSAEMMVESLDRALLRDSVSFTGDSLELALGFEFPRVVSKEVDAEWAVQFRDRVAFLAERLRAGEPPVPLCTADEMILHVVAAVAQSQVDEWLGSGWSPHGYPELEQALPHHPEDYRFRDLITLLVKDEDVLMLYSPRLAFLAEDPGWLLHPSNWFVPFFAVDA